MYLFNPFRFFLHFALRNLFFGTWRSQYGKVFMLTVLFCIDHILLYDFKLAFSKVTLTTYGNFPISFVKISINIIYFSVFSSLEACNLHDLLYPYLNIYLVISNKKIVLFQMLSHLRLSNTFSVFIIFFILII